MAEEHRSEGADSRYEQWVAMWAAGVRASGPPMAVGDLTTASFIELSPAATRLVGDAQNYLHIAEPREASAELLRLMSEGLIEGARTHRRLRAADGLFIDIDAIGWVVRSPDGPDLAIGLWIADSVSSATDSGPEVVVSPALPKQDHAHPRGDHLIVDESWRIREIGASGDRVVGWSRQELLNSSMLERMHPDDVPALLFALARATNSPTASALVRVRHPDGIWRAVDIAPTVANDEVRALVALVLVAAPEPVVGPPGSSITDIPSELRRIADHIETAAVMAPLTEVTDALNLVAAGLSPRQREVLRRLVRGERVSTIAGEMYLSRSTIRNHLTAIFSKVGVHSQEELVGLYHRVPDDPSAR